MATGVSRTSITPCRRQTCYRLYRVAPASHPNVRLAAPCDRASPLPMTARGPQLGRPIMRKLLTTIALLALVDTSAALAQTAGSPDPAAPPSATHDKPR